MKKIIYLLSILTIVSCKKEELPIESVSLSINGQITNMTRITIGNTGNDQIVKISSMTDQNAIEFNLGAEITGNHEIKQTSYPGFQDHVKLSFGNNMYYQYDTTEVFFINLQDSSGYYSGSLSGTLENPTEGVINVCGEFVNAQ